MSLFLGLTLVSIAGMILAWYLTKKRRLRWLAGIIAVVAFFSGYLVHAGRFLGQEDSRHVPELTRSAGDSVAGHTAVVYFTHGEPETYNPIGWLNQFREFNLFPFLPAPSSYICCVTSILK